MYAIPSRTSIDPRPSTPDGTSSQPTTVGARGSANVTTTSRLPDAAGPTTIATGWSGAPGVTVSSVTTTCDPTRSTGASSGPSNGPVQITSPVCRCAMASARRPVVTTTGPLAPSTTRSARSKSACWDGTTGRGSGGFGTAVSLVSSAMVCRIASCANPRPAVFRSRRSPVRPDAVAVASAHRRCIVGMSITCSPLPSPLVNA